jgi:glycerol-3-phosphate acyltransferase PlsY
MMTLFLITAGTIISYLIGSIPFGLILSKKIYNVDIRSVGSGNIGATNATRVGGLKLGIMVFILDGLKAIVCGLVGLAFQDPDTTFIAPLFCSAVFIGHLFPIFLKFKGGKGISVIVFSFLLLNQPLFAIFVSIWLTVFLLTRYSSLAAIIAILISYVAIYIMAMYMDNQIPLSLLGLVTTATCLILIKHIPNIHRLIDGTESKFGKVKNNI